MPAQARAPTRPPRSPPCPYCGLPLHSYSLLTGCESCWVNRNSRLWSHGRALGARKVDLSAYRGRGEGLWG